jgi:alpha-glucosidase
MKWFLLALLALSALICGCSSGDVNNDDDHSAPADDDTHAVDDDAAGDDDTLNPDWYRTATFMQIFLRSFYDSNGDGIGDLRGLIVKLPYLAELGIGAIWLNPIYPSPFFDSGYDVADYEAINPDYGTLDDFRELLDRAHELGIRIVMDGVFNHSSWENPWFVESRSSRDNPKHDWYVWGDEPLFDCHDPLEPEFGQDRWTFDETVGQYYYHFFREQMPDLNYENADLREAVKNVVRFWFDLGVDGFRLDAAHLYYQDAEYCWNHPKTHAFLKELRQVADEYGDRVFVGEVAGAPEKVIEYLGDGRDELQAIINFNLTYGFYASYFLHTPWPIETMMDLTYERFPPGGTHAVYQSNHDFYRMFGLLLGDDDWAKMTSVVQLTLPGIAFVYYGEEVGMTNGHEVVVDYRDAARTPMHWDASPTAGFTTGEPWIALAPNHATHNVAVEDGDPHSLLNHYRRVIAIRNARPVLAEGSYTPVVADSNHVFADLRQSADDSLLVVINFSAKPQEATLDLSPTSWGGRVGTPRDLYSGAELPHLDAFSAAAYPVSLPAYGFVILELVGD